jgi:hypothetical protein
VGQCELEQIILKASTKRKEEKEETHFNSHNQYTQTISP